MYSRQREDAQGQHVELSPQLVADVWAQPGADTDGDPKVKGDDAERHPLRAIMARERNEYLVPAEAGEGINPHGQHMHHQKDGAKQRQKVVQFAIDQTRPATGRLELCRERQAHHHGQGE